MSSLSRKIDNCPQSCPTAPLPPSLLFSSPSLPHPLSPSSFSQYGYTALISASITNPGWVAAACRWQGSGSSESPWSLERHPSATVCHPGAGLHQHLETSLCPQRKTGSAWPQRGCHRSALCLSCFRPDGTLDAVPTPSLQHSPNRCTLTASPSNCHASHPDLTCFMVSIAQPHLLGWRQQSSWSVTEITVSPGHSFLEE